MTQEKKTLVEVISGGFDVQENTEIMLQWSILRQTDQERKVGRKATTEASKCAISVDFNGITPELVLDQFVKGFKVSSAAHLKTLNDSDYEALMERDGSVKWDEAWSQDRAKGNGGGHAKVLRNTNEMAHLLAGNGVPKDIVQKAVETALTGVKDNEMAIKAIMGTLKFS